MCNDMCNEVCMAMGTDMCTDMCIDMCTDMCTYVRIDMCIDTCGRGHGDGCGGRSVFFLALSRHRRWHVHGSISASPTARPLRGYGRAGAQNDRLSLSEVAILSTGTPVPAQWNAVGDAEIAVWSR